MLKEYTLKVTVRIGGETVDVCDERLNEIFSYNTDIDTWEITHEEVVQPDEVERE